jgi:hypothetical protein
MQNGVSIRRNGRGGGRWALGAAILALLAGTTGCTRPDPPAEHEHNHGPSPATRLEPNGATPETLAQAMDVPVYPGSRVPDGVSRAPQPDGHGGTRYELVMHTSDSVGEVSAFYRERLGLAAMEEGDHAQLIGKTPNGNDAIIRIVRDGEMTTIRVNVIAYGPEPPT